MKRPSFAKVSRYAVCGVAGAMIAMLGAKAAGLRFNATPSIPLGVYRATGGPRKRAILWRSVRPQRRPFWRRCVGATSNPATAPAEAMK